VISVFCQMCERHIVCMFSFGTLCYKCLLESFLCFVFHIPNTKECAAHVTCCSSVNSAWCLYCRCHRYSDSVYVDTVGRQTAVNAGKTGTKCAAVHCLTLQPHSHAVVCCRLHSASLTVDAAFGKQFEAIFSLRELECREFYKRVSPSFALTVNSYTLSRNGRAYRVPD